LPEMHEWIPARQRPWSDASLIRNVPEMHAIPVKPRDDSTRKSNSLSDQRTLVTKTVRNACREAISSKSLNNSGIDSLRRAQPSVKVASTASSVNSAQSADNSPVRPRRSAPSGPQSPPKTTQSQDSTHPPLPLGSLKWSTDQILRPSRPL
jgi:hypothetical protein